MKRLKGHQGSYEGTPGAHDVTLNAESNQHVSLTLLLLYLRVPEPVCDDVR